MTYGSFLSGDPRGFYDFVQIWKNVGWHFCLEMRLACDSDYMCHRHPLQWSWLGIVHHPSASHFFQNLLST